MVRDELPMSVKIIRKIAAIVECYIWKKRTFIIINLVQKKWKALQHKNHGNENYDTDDDKNDDSKEEKEQNDDDDDDDGCDEDDNKNKMVQKVWCEGATT